MSDPWSPEKQRPGSLHVDKYLEMFPEKLEERLQLYLEAIRVLSKIRFWRRWSRQNNIARGGLNRLKHRLLSRAWEKWQVPSSHAK